MAGILCHCFFARVVGTVIDYEGDTSDEWVNRSFAALLHSFSDSVDESEVASGIDSCRELLRKRRLNAKNFLEDPAKHLLMASVTIVLNALNLNVPVEGLSLLRVIRLMRVVRVFLQPVKRITYYF